LSPFVDDDEDETDRMLENMEVNGKKYLKLN
jgi:hypothetical protein